MKKTLKHFQQNRIENLSKITGGKDNHAQTTKESTSTATTHKWWENTTNRVEDRRSMVIELQD